MTEVTIPADDSHALIAHVTGGNTELCAVLYTSQYVRPDALTRLLVRNMEFPSPSDYTRIGPLEAELSPDFVARVSKRARLEDSGLVFVHSHPGGFPPKFSHVDDDGEVRLAQFLAHRNPNRTHVALVASRGGINARVLGTREPVTVVALGDYREILYSRDPPHESTEKHYDRQVRAFGRQSQVDLQRVRVAIVGLGGTGSIVAQELVHLGVQKFILIDPDVVDETNLNRVANATNADIGANKVDVARRYINQINALANVESFVGDIVRANYARAVLNADLMFGCTDSHGSRAVLQQVAYQYLIPCIDVGSTIVVTDGRVTHIIGRIQMLTPGLGCFTCSNLLDSNEVRRDMMSEAERKVDPYLQGVREPAPAVMSLNGTLASIGVTMFLSHIAHVPVAARHLIYDALASRLRSVHVPPLSDCFNCSKSGDFAHGDSSRLRVRDN